MVNQAVVKVTGYGPPGLVKAVRGAEWSPCADQGENFAGISFGGYCLVRPFDEESPLELRITVSDEGDEVSVHGWVHLNAMVVGQRAANDVEGSSSAFGGPFLRLAKSSMTREPTQDNTVRYEVEITPLS